MAQDTTKVHELIAVGLSDPAVEMPRVLRCPSLHHVMLVTISVQHDQRAATFPCYPCLDCGVVYRASECSPHGVESL